MLSETRDERRSEREQIIRTRDQAKQKVMIADTVVLGGWIRLWRVSFWPKSVNWRLRAGEGRGAGL